VSAAPKAVIAPKADTEERTIVVENDLYRVEFSNRGAVVKSWQLKKYTDDAKPPRILDLVHPDAAQQTGGWPFAVALNDQQQESAANGALYQISTPASTLHAPPMRNSVGATVTWKSPNASTSTTRTWWAWRRRPNSTALLFWRG